MLVDCFWEKNAEYDYFDQRLECAVPKRWSKYTTDITLFLLTAQQELPDNDWLLAPPHPATTSRVFWPGISWHLNFLSYFWCLIFHRIFNALNFFFLVLNSLDTLIDQVSYESFAQAWMVILMELVVYLWQRVPTLTLHAIASILKA